MGALVTRAHGAGHVPEPSLSARGKLRRAGTALGGGPFRDGKKLSEPHDWQQGATNLHGRRGKSVEVVRNHVDGTRGGLAVLPRRELRRRGPLESDSSVRYDGGAIFGNPKRGSSTGRSDRMDSDATGESASRSGGSRTHALVCSAPRSIGTSRITGLHWLHRWSDALKVEEGSGEANSRGSDRGTPPVEGPRGRERTARHRFAARKRIQSSEHAWFAT